MINVKIYNTKAEEVGSVALSAIFEEKYRESLIHQVVVAQLANKRQGTKSTLTRSEVRGGGAKPWRQKGTGRARQGSIRSPQWIKGGVVFAPKPRDFSQKINKKMKKIALKSALSAKVSENNFIVLDKFILNEAKTKEVAQVLKNFNLKERVLLVLSNDDALVVRAASNIANIKTINVNLLNVYDVVANSKLMITSDALKMLEEANA